MSEPVIQGWCPGALRPMLSGDGLVVRIRTRGGRLVPEQATEIARLSKRYGNGVIDISSRANIQLRGVTAESHGPLIAGLAALGLIDVNATTEAKRNIVVAPFWSDGDGTQELATRLAVALADPAAPDLPGKFGFAVDIGPSPVLRDVSADIRFERDGQGGLICRPDGAKQGAPVSLDNAAQSAMALARWFVDSGGIHDGRGRMGPHLQEGAKLPHNYGGAAMRDCSNFRARPGVVLGGFLVALPFGQISADSFSRLADLGALRVTPWRMLLIEGLRDVPADDGLIIRADDPMLRVIACTGAPDCIQAYAPTRPLARSLAPMLPQDTLLHVSGCKKGCAHPGCAPLTLTAGEDGFALVHHGRAGDPPSASPLTAAALVTQPELLIEARG